MAKLSKAAAKAHNEACELLKKDFLTIDEREFVYENWNEAARHINSLSGAHFTPMGLAADFQLEYNGSKNIIDLCAGIGALSFYGFTRSRFTNDDINITCIEFNHDYVEVGKKLLPEATWICGDITDRALIESLGKFDCAISNPPFGGNGTSGKWLKYSGGKFEFKAIEIASYLADYGVFILPQMSAPFRFSGCQTFESQDSSEYQKFNQQTGIELTSGIGIDTSIYKDEWKTTSVICEIVTADFNDVRRARKNSEPKAVWEAA